MLLKDGLEDSCVAQNFVKFAEKHPWWSLLLRKLQYLVSPLFWTKRFTKYVFLEIYEIIQYN